MDDIRHVGQYEQLKVLANADRLAILRHVMAEPATLTQLGARFGKHPAWIRHHVLALERAGLIELAETRAVHGHQEKYYAAAARAFAVDFMVVPETRARGLLVIVGSDDAALDLLAADLRADPAAPDILTMRMGSLEGLIALRHGLGDAAGCHLLDADTGEYNRSYAQHLFPGSLLSLVTLAHREQGLIVAPGNPRGFGSIADVAASGAVFVNRNVGSGTRVWLDRYLAGKGLGAAALNGYVTEVTSHGEAAALIAAGRADAALGIRAAAARQGLGFVPLFKEQYDLVMPHDIFTSARFHPVLARLESADFKRHVEDLAGYDTSAMGAVIQLSA